MISVLQNKFQLSYGFASKVTVLSLAGVRGTEGEEEWRLREIFAVAYMPMCEV